MMINLLVSVLKKKVISEVIICALLTVNVRVCRDLAVNIGFIKRPRKTMQKGKANSKSIDKQIIPGKG